MTAFAQLAEDQIEQAPDNEEARHRQVHRITSMLANRDVEMVYQPAIRLETLSVEFVEALARYRPKSYKVRLLTDVSSIPRNPSGIGASQ